MTRRLHLISSDFGPELPAPAPSSRTIEQLYEDHFEFTWRVLRHLGLSEPVLSDACQELWLVVHRRLPTLELRGEMTTWLFGIAMNVARNQRRMHSRHRAVGELPMDLASSALDPEALNAARETCAAVQRFLDRLDDTDRWIFGFNIVEQLSAQETALALEIQVGTVYQRVRALKRALVKWLDS